MKWIGLVLLLAAVGCHGQKGSVNTVPANADKEFVGFDRNEYPGDDRLAELHRHFAFSGYWLNVPPGAKSNPWAGKRKALRDAGFGFLVLWNGRLEAEIGAATVTPEAFGRKDAAAALAAARAEGFPTGTVIFLDQEEGGRLTDAQAAYFFGWTETVAASGYRPGSYLSGQVSPDGNGPDGKPAFITTAQDVRARVKASRGKLHDVMLWVYEDGCPPSPGCTLAAPKLKDSGIGGVADAMAWQYAQSPRRPATKACAATYGADGLCYAGATTDLFVDLNVARSADPSSGR